MLGAFRTVVDRGVLSRQRLGCFAGCRGPGRLSQSQADFTSYFAMFKLVLSSVHIHAAYKKREPRIPLLLRYGCYQSDIVSKYRAVIRLIKTPIHGNGMNTKSSIPSFRRKSEKKHYFEKLHGGFDPMKTRKNIIRRRHKAN